MTEEKFYRISAVVGFVVAAVGLAITLGVTVTAWLGWAVLAGCLLPVSLKLIGMERDRLETQARIEASRNVVPGPWVQEHAEQV